jgi:hypothetical protein
MKKVTIYGERCSGTNYLEELLLLNFDVEITWEFGWKHFFGHNDLSNSDDVLFIGIIRNICDWINSLYREKHHLPANLTRNIKTFLTKPFYSLHSGSENENMADRNIETNERYKNIFEARLVKNKYLIEKMPTLVKHYCMITYDDLTTDFVKIMNQLKNCGLEVKNNISFPLNVFYYKKDKNKNYCVKVKNNINQIPKEIIGRIIIKKQELLFYERLLFSKKIDK